MEYNDYYNPHDEIDSLDSKLNKLNLLEESKAIDRGYSKIYRYIETNNGMFKRLKVELYTSGDMGSNIRDAETGEYYKYKVGSLDEQLFFKVTMATGECKSLNGSNILFYTSPYQFMSHQNEDISDEVIEKWQQTRDRRLKFIDTMKKPRVAVIVK
jgi:hypothetical protein